ncbi:MAG: tetratricopeptide repeat protein [Polyangiales bacterium]
MAPLRSLLALLLSLSLFMVAPTARAQSDDEAAHARLLAEYQATPTISTGCSLGEVERRLGRLDQAATRLDELLTRARQDPALDPATLSACRFNRARVYEEQGDLRNAYRLLGEALTTPNATRRRVVEQRLVDVATRLVSSPAGCMALTSRYSPQALLRFKDSAPLRACARTYARAHPFCTPMATEDMPDPASAPRYMSRRPDDATVAIIDEGYLMILTTQRGRTTGIECRLPNPDELIESAAWVGTGRARLLRVVTNSTVSYTCGGDDPEYGEDERCSDASSTHYLLTPRGELVLALVDAFEDGGMAAWGADAPELRDPNVSGATVEGNVILVNGRRLRMVRGALIPAP